MFYDLEMNEIRAQERAEGRTEGRAEGRTQGRNEILQELILDGTYNDEQLSRLAKVPVEDVRRMREELTSSKSA